MESKKNAKKKRKIDQEKPSCQIFLFSLSLFSSCFSRFFTSDFKTIKKGSHSTHSQNFFFFFESLLFLFFRRSPVSFFLPFEERVFIYFYRFLLTVVKKNFDPCLDFSFFPSLLLLTQIVAEKSTFVLNSTNFFLDKTKRHHDKKWTAQF